MKSATNCATYTYLLLLVYTWCLVRSTDVSCCDHDLQLIQLLTPCSAVPVNAPLPNPAAPGHEEHHHSLLAVVRRQTSTWYLTCMSVVPGTWYHYGRKFKDLLDTDINTVTVLTFTFIVVYLLADVDNTEDRVRTVKDITYAPKERHRTRRRTARSAAGRALKTTPTTYGFLYSVAQQDDCH